MMTRKWNELTAKLTGIRKFISEADTDNQMIGFYLLFVMFMLIVLFEVQL